MTRRQVFYLLTTVVGVLFAAVIILWIAAVIVGSPTLGAIGGILLLPFFGAFFPALAIALLEFEDM